MAIRCVLLSLVALPDYVRRHPLLLKKILMRVNTTALIILIGLLQASAATFAQKISLNEKNAPLKKVISSIEQQSGYVFFYDDKDLAKETVTVRLNDANITEALDQCFKSLPLSYRITNKTIVLSKIEQALPEKVKPVAVAATTITGTVLDELNKPMPGVAVKIKGSSIGTVTDDKGNFSIAVDNNDVVLTFSFIGYEKQDIKVDGKRVINITMRPVPTALNDVVVVGYGAQKKANLTGAVSSVSAAQLENRPVTGVTNALQGTVPGVTIVSNNGQPGKDAGSIKIRGIGTLNNTNPMIVIDGVISTPTDMNAVNADDIDNISVLKDAASSSIYGSRAANGVIVITTKKGKKGTAQITYSNYFGKQTATALPDYLPSWQAATLYNEARVNEGKSSLYTAQQIQTFKDGSDPANYPNTDWLKLFYKGSGFQQNHFVGVNGGGDKTQYAFSLGYFDQDGITPKTNTQRYTTRLNVNSQVNNKLSFNANLSYTYQPLIEPQSSFPGVPDFTQMIRQINRISNIIPYKFPNGQYGHISDGNPMAWLNSPSFNNQNAYNLQGIAGADWEIIKGLHLKPSLGYKLVQNQNKNFVSSIQYYNPDGTTSGQANLSSATDTYNSTTIVTPQALLDYSVKVGNHGFKALVGYSQEYTKYYTLTGYRQGFLNNALSDLTAAPTDGQTSTADSYEVALRSVFGRINYDYKGKYLLEADLRDDGSSRFAPSLRWGLYPGGSAGWRVSEEDFFSPLKNVLSNLKLRASWGQLGNQNLTGNTYTSVYYPYIPTVTTINQGYPFGGVVNGGVAPVDGANTALVWEKTTDTNFGLDADFLNGKFSFTADYFIKNTTGILYDLPVGAPYGLNPPYQNTSSVRNKGWEFALTYREKVGAFVFNVSGNTALVQNTVTGLGPSSAPVISGSTITKVGLPISAFWGYQTQGIFQSAQQVSQHATQNLGGPTGPGDLIYKDVNGDGKIDGNDKVYLGSNFPKVTFGLNINVVWKQFDLTGFFQGAAGVKNIISGPMLGQNGNAVGKPTSALLNSWSASNTSSDFPRLWINYRQNDPASNPSSFWVKDASYVRLKNLQLGYTLPQKWSDALHIKKLRVYYSGQNVATFTKFYKWVDPEAPRGETGYNYPQVKINTLGLNVSF
ncbi:TonB-dependent receptor [Mucilaginibacter sp. Mucisp86]|uniref:TonB-dependent receptor n=1 Tax=Mucilaginibacter sp. Mucisp86 TaxID=3243060 RepID=UPI0039B46348